METELQKLKLELRLRNYSPKTIKTYMKYVRRYFEECGVKEELDVDELRSFLVGKQDSGLSPQTVNLYLNAVKFYFREVKGDKKKVPIKFARRSTRPLVF